MDPSPAKHFPVRPRRMRRDDFSRRLMREHVLTANDLIYPVFVHEGQGRVPVASMPGVDRLSIDELLKVGEQALELGVPVLDLFGVPDQQAKTADGRIAEFAQMGWDPAVVPDPQDPETFTRSRLDWAEKDSGDHARLLDLYRQLAQLRRSTEELTDPSFRSLAATFSDEAHWFRLDRGDVSVMFNLGADQLTLPLTGPAELLLATDDAVAVTGTGVSLPFHSAAIIRRS